MKKCPYCAEEIQDDAVKCKHCGEFLKSAGEKWYFKNLSILVGFLCVGPLVLPLVWFHPRYSRMQKIIFTLLMLIVTYLLWVLLDRSLQAIGAYYDQLQSVFN